jgi:large subunit ribosomal protein L22
MKVPAHARYVRQSPTKVRAVLDTVRGLSVDDAIVSLAVTDRRAADTVKKVLESAVANALENHDIPSEDLVVAEAYANEGPTLKRFRPRARGRATQILKRTSHITIVVANDEED